MNTKLIEAVGKLVKAKGRFHTEQNYKAVVEAYDEALAERASNPASPADPLMELRERIKEMQEAAYTYGDYSKEAVRVALDGVIDEIDGLSSGAASPAPVAAITDEQDEIDLGDDLPPLPAPIEVGGEGWDWDDFQREKTFTADHMTAYARAALAAAPQAQAAQQKPVAYSLTFARGGLVVNPETIFATSGQAQEYADGFMLPRPVVTPLYATPAATSGTGARQSAGSGLCNAV